MSVTKNPRQGNRPTLSNRKFRQEEVEALVAEGVPLDFDGCGFPGVRFDHLTLEGWDFYGCDFDAVSFANAHLNKVRWFGCQVRHASFRGARLERARFKDSSFAMTDWDESVLSDAVFDAVDLRDAWFAGASLRDVSMFEVVGAELEGARIENTSVYALRHLDSEVVELGAAAGLPGKRACCFERLGDSAV